MSESTSFFVTYCVEITKATIYSLEPRLDHLSLETGKYFSHNALILFPSSPYIVAAGSQFQDNTTFSHYCFALFQS